LRPRAVGERRGRRRYVNGSLTDLLPKTCALARRYVFRRNRN
jgi:hypothetical protein